jgi:RNase P/RNase MRP subunit POP5
MKLKSLKPSMRENKRYLLVRGSSLSKDKIEKAILEFIGVNGMSKTGLEFIKSDNGKMIIAVNREMMDNVRASLCVYKDKMSVEKVSGSVKGVK